MLPLAVMAQLDTQLTPELFAIGAATTLASLLAILSTLTALALLRRSNRLTNSKGT